MLLKIQKPVAVIVLSVILFTAIFGPIQSSGAEVPTGDKKNLVVNSNSSWQDTLNVTVKKFGLDVAATAAMKLIISMLRDAVIQWIVTGQFDLPLFTGSYFADPTRWAEYATRMLLTQLTGINFCNYGYSVPKTITSQTTLRFNFSCSLGYQEFISLSTTNLGQGGSAFIQNIPYIIAETDDLDEVMKLGYIKKTSRGVTIGRRMDEILSSLGFTGIKDPKTGKIKTPGAVVEGFLRESIGSNYRACDAAKEFQEAIISCGLSALADILDAGVGKIISDGLDEAFPPQAQPAPAPSTPPPVFDFSLASGGAISVSQGSATTTSVLAPRMSGSAQLVNFSASGLPAGAVALFSPTGCIATCSASLMITTLTSTPAGTYTITVTGKSGGLTRFTSFLLTVTP